MNLSVSASCSDRIAYLRNPTTNTHKTRAVGAKGQFFDCLVLRMAAQGTTIRNNGTYIVSICFGSFRVIMVCSCAALRCTALGAGLRRSTGGILPTMASCAALGSAALGADLRRSASGILPAMASCATLGGPALGAGLRRSASGILPAMASLAALGSPALGAGLRRSTSGILPAMANCAALGSTTGFASPRGFTSSIDPFMFMKLREHAGVVLQDHHSVHIVHFTIAVHVAVAEVQRIVTDHAGVVLQHDHGVYIIHLAAAVGIAQQAGIRDRCKRHAGQHAKHHTQRQYETDHSFFHFQGSPFLCMY